MNTRIFISCVCFIFAAYVASAQPKDGQKHKVSPAQYWQMGAMDTDKVFGAEIWKAYDYLKKVEPKARTIVAIIDGGTELDHEDLKAALWVNRGEIPGNGIDDDGNGYVDDVHGWNFAGRKDGSQLETGSLEADREYLVLSEQFEGVDTSGLSRKEYKRYRYFKENVEPFSSIWQAKRDIAGAKAVERYAELFEKELRAKDPNRKAFSGADLASIMKNGETDAARWEAYEFCVRKMKGNPLMSWTKLYAQRDDLVKDAEKEYRKRVETVKTSERERAALGDNQNDASDRNYGNNRLAGKKSALHGMHVGGIVGATRNNGIGMDGVADVELMFIRLHEGDGDERDKDVASAIYYAADNGARVINMSFGKRTSPGKGMVEKALRYAEKKGILLVHAAGNDGASIEEHHLYPSKHADGKRDLKNWISVGSIGMTGHPAKSSNYGKREVDLFAPGDGVYSSVPGNKYKNLRGTSMAAPVVAGTAALIWNYFPELSAREVKQALLKGVTCRKGEKVTKPGLSGTLVQVDFEELCATGGVLNALGAVKIAEKMYMKKSK